MIELRDDSLVFSFPQVHEAARFEIGFQRTLRIPDDGRDYPLPPGLGCFPLRHVDDFSEKVPEAWLRHGGVMLPMYQSEAMWLNFRSLSHELATPERPEWYGLADAVPYPFAVKIATGKINAVTGGPWRNGLQTDPQDYVVIPTQPWLDGYSVEKGLIRQFMAMPLGAGYTVEEQVTGAAEHGGVQIVAYPMKRTAYLRRLEEWKKKQRARRLEFERGLAVQALGARRSRLYCSMGLAPGGRMRQEIYDDPYGFHDWDTGHASRCFVHLTNSLVWRQITGQNPPTTPPTASEYERRGLPWFEYYGAEAAALEGSDVLAELESVAVMGKKKGDSPLPENEPVTPGRVVRLRAGLKPGQVREGTF